MPRTAPITTLGARPTLPFLLATPESLQDDSVIENILGRLESLQKIATESWLELQMLRQVNAEILESVNQRPAAAQTQPPAPAAAELTVAPTRLSLRLLGPFEAWIGDTAVSAWPGRKARLLLAYLAMERGRMVPKDVLIELFWPGAREDRGANNLSIAVHQIRSSLASVSQEAARAIVVKQGLYGIDATLVEVDLWELQADLDQARRALEGRDKSAAQDHLRHALDLCRGELLASDPYEEWSAEPRRVFNTAYHKALTWLAAEASTQQDWVGVLDYAGRMLQRDACDEGAHRLAMTAHLRMGNRSQALQQYQACIAALRDELGVQPSQETRELARTLVA